MQRKRRKVDAACSTIVQTSFVGKYVFAHPCRRTAADNQLQPVVRRSPRVPKILECLYETAFLSIHPRELVEEDDDGLIAA